MSEIYDQIVALYRRLTTDVAFNEIVRQEANRTLFCNPADGDRVRWHVDQSGCADLFDVVESEFVKPGQMLAMDRQAIDASLSEALQHMPLYWP